ncbi:MAG: ImmA/IrrE family metallo-endopeptidase, partial [Evtepia sp.]
KRIENSSIELLQAFLAKTKFEFKPPVAVEDILEFMYQVTPQVADLQALYGNEAVLGRSQYIDGQIVMEVDQTIYPYPPQNNEKMLGRYRYTLAHEVGHICLHLPDEIAKAKQGDLWDDAKPFVFSVFRKEDYAIVAPKDPKEWQADRFAKYLLMPTQLIYSAWNEIFGPDHGPENVFDEMEELRKIAVRPEYVRAQIVRDMAEIFDVSAEAMQYRLVGMKLLEVEKQLQGTFNF